MEKFKGIVNSIVVYRYRADENSENIKKDYLIENIFFLYDRDGNILEQKYYSPEDGSLRRKSIYKYNEKKHLLEQADYFGDEELDKKIVYSHNDRGMHIAAQRYNSEGLLLNTYKYKYDNYGNQIEWISYKLDGSIKMRFTLDYDDRGNELVNVQYNPDGSISLITSYELDQDDNRIVGRFENKFRKNTCVFKYVGFDSVGNWLRKITIENKIPVFIEERELEYFL